MQSDLSLVIGGLVTLVEACWLSWRVLAIYVA